MRRPPARVLPTVFVTALTVLVGCGGDDQGDGTPDADADTTLEVLLPDSTGDTSVPPDTTPPDTTPDSTAPDTAPDTTPPDITPGCTTFGCPCATNSDCDSLVCIEALDGLTCSQSCFAECPSGYDCLQVTTGGADTASVCVPRHTRLCRPCRTHDECRAPSDPFPAYCIPDPSPAPAGSTGSFCGSSCATRPCPTGFTCEDVALADGGTARQCIPVSGQCECRPSWAGLGFSTTCDVTNAFGTCDGTRSCEASGLSACDGPQAAPELCDGQDNDCDGQTDNLPETPCYVTNALGSCPGRMACSGNAPRCEGPEAMPESCNGLDDDCDGQTDETTCGDGLTCTTDTCVAPFQCANTLVAGQCLINGACHLAQAYNPVNACELCDPARSVSTWSQAPNTCVIGDGCYPANAVNPLNACQICQPNQSTTSWVNASNTCQIGGQCYGPNEANPNNPCEICAPATSTTTWTQAQNTCNIQGQCYAAGVTRPGLPCQVCDPSRSASGWSNAANTVACDDGNACSAQSFCNGAGACIGDTTCNDGVVCTQDLCNAQSGCDNSQVAAGYCRIGGVCYTTNTANPSNPCERCNPAQSTTAWSPQPNTVGCNDNLFCTVNDRCNGQGSCGGEPRNCGDGLTCTTDGCDEAQDRCTNTLQANQCVISGSCVSNGTTQPNNVCYRCNSALSTSAWSLNNGASCNDSEVCTNNDTCSGGICAGTPIQDGYEPNNAIGAARSVAANAICDNGDQQTPAGSFTATLYGAGDDDWFKYRINDDCSNRQPAPWVRLTNIPTNVNYNLCVYWQCDDFGNGDKGACEAGGGAASTTSLNGVTLKGCCSTNAGTASEFVWYYPECDNGGTFGADNDTGTAYFRVFRASGDWTCSPYTIQFGDD